MTAIAMTCTDSYAVIMPDNLYMMGHVRGGNGAWDTNRLEGKAINATQFVFDNPLATGWNENGTNRSSFAFIDGNGIEYRARIDGENADVNVSNDGTEYTMYSGDKANKGWAVNTNDCERITVDFSGDSPVFWLGKITRQQGVYLKGHVDFSAWDAYVEPTSRNEDVYEWDVELTGYGAQPNWSTFNFVVVDQDGNETTYGPGGGSDKNITGAHTETVTEHSCGWQMLSAAYHIQLDMSGDNPVMSVRKRYFLIGDVNDWFRAWGTDGKASNDVFSPTYREDRKAWEFHYAYTDTEDNEPVYKLDVPTRDGKFWGQFQIFDGLWNDGSRDKEHFGHSWSCSFEAESGDNMEDSGYQQYLSRNNDKSKYEDWGYLNHAIESGEWYTPAHVLDRDADGVRNNYMHNMNMTLAHNAYTGTTIYFKPGLDLRERDAAYEEATPNKRDYSARVMIDGKPLDYYIFFGINEVIDNDVDVTAHIKGDNPNSINYFLPRYDGHMYEDATLNNGADGTLGVKLEKIAVSALKEDPRFKDLLNFNNGQTILPNGRNVTTRDYLYVAKIPNGFECPAGAKFRVNIDNEARGSEVSANNYVFNIYNKHIYIFDPSYVHAFVHYGTDEDSSRIKVYYRVYGLNDDYKLAVMNPENERLEYVVGENGVDATSDHGWILLDGDNYSHPLRPDLKWRYAQATPIGAKAGRTRDAAEQEVRVSVPIEHSNAFVQYRIVRDYDHPDLDSRIHYIPETLQTGGFSDPDMDEACNLRGRDVFLTWGDIQTGVESIEPEDTDATQEAIYYNLQGLRVAVPTHGLYIMVQDGKSRKVMFNQ